MGPSTESIRQSSGTCEVDTRKAEKKGKHKVRATQRKGQATSDAHSMKRIKSLQHAPAPRRLFQRTQAISSASSKVFTARKPTGQRPRARWLAANRRSRHLPLYPLDSTRLYPLGKPFHLPPPQPPPPSPPVPPRLRTWKNEGSKAGWSGASGLKLSIRMSRATLPSRGMRAATGKPRGAASSSVPRRCARCPPRGEGAPGAPGEP